MKRMFACSLLVLAVPIINATLQPGANSNAPFAATAFAGHTTAGGWCECGCPGCLCDPGEQIEMCLPDAKDAAGIAIDPAGVPAPSSQSQVPAAAFFVGTGLLIWKRIRR
jgi:hypothetical protein